MYIPYSVLMIYFCLYWKFLPVVNFCQLHQLSRVTKSKLAIFKPNNLQDRCQEYEMYENIFPQCYDTSVGKKISWCKICHYMVAVSKTWTTKVEFAVFVVKAGALNELVTNIGLCHEGTVLECWIQYWNVLACHEELNLKKNVIVFHVSSAKHKTSFQENISF